ncbi:PLP-dependent aminotransferase family protein [Niabella yanshanensis]|uniref:PLP-dependent aminotransferase family protein n=1 Tax=Niabella yanshanensis TaxID=577386 RepID=A0ABZ0W6P9_9BACT|nr:PLP-dependent aminotransferase family protein [Niabella yanshanensis]WQD38973.1 PLP-dependent aminotransferase family protein [Niabella yanshanensis]
MLRPWKLSLKINYGCDKPIYLQIADAIISDIQSGRLKQGTALPGSRKLSEELKLNRNTIVDALQVLLNEEWLVAKERKGTFVADKLPLLSHYLKVPVAIDSMAAEPLSPRIHFDDGYPDSKIAPIAELARAYRQIFNRKARRQLMGYGSELGDWKFRQELGRMLNHNRGMQVATQQLCVTRGSQMAMYLTAQCLLKEGDWVVVENPGYKPAWKAFEQAGARLIPVNVDKEGMVTHDVKQLLQSGRKIKALYTTPHHQYPTTVTMSLQRRLELIQLSNKYGFTIIEDDYDNEFHFGYRPVLPLCSFDELIRYVYVGTMSKVVAPALRIGYLATTIPGLMGKIGSLRKIIDVQGDAIMEQAVLQLVHDGTIKKHLKKATHYYRAKRALTEALLIKYIGEKACYTIPEGGLAFWIVPSRKCNWVHIATQLQKKGIGIITPDQYSFGKVINGIRLSYGALSAEQLEEGLRELALLL